MLAHAEVQVAALAGARLRTAASAFTKVLVDGARSAEPPMSVGTCGAMAFSACAGGGARGQRTVLGREDRQVGVPPRRRLARPGAIPGRRQLGLGDAPGGEALRATRVCAAAPRSPASAKRGRTSAGTRKVGS